MHVFPDMMNDRDYNIDQNNRDYDFGHNPAALVCKFLQRRHKVAKPS